MANQLPQAIEVAGQAIGAGLMLGVGAAGASIGDGLAGSQLVAGVARQPEAQGRLFTPFFITVALAEGNFFISLVFGAILIFGGAA